MSVLSNSFVDLSSFPISLYGAFAYFPADNDGKTRSYCLASCSFAGKEGGRKGVSFLSDGPEQRGGYFILFSKHTTVRELVFFSLALFCLPKFFVRFSWKNV